MACSLGYTFIFELIATSIFTVPSVAVAALVIGLFRWDQALKYMVAQFAGVYGGFELLNKVLGNVDITDAGLCLSASEKLNKFQIVTMEFLIGLVLIFGLLAMVDEGNIVEISALRFGSFITILIIAGVLMSATGLNSANNFDKLLFHLGGYFLAGISAPFIWNYVGSQLRCGY